MNGLHPLSFCSSTAAFGMADEGYALHLVNGDGLGERTFRLHVDFAVEFETPPVVHVGLSAFDVDHVDSARLRVHVEQITESGFDLVVTTWRATRVYSAEASWLAIGRAGSSLD